MDRFQTDRIIEALEEISIQLSQANHLKAIELELKHSIEVEIDEKFHTVSYTYNDEME